MPESSPPVLSDEARGDLEAELPLFMRSRLFESARLTRFRPDQQVWAVGDRPEWLAILARGTWIISTSDDQGTPRVLDVCGRGAVLGSADVFGDAPRRSGVESFGASLGLVLPASAMRAALRAGGACAEAANSLVLWALAAMNQAAHAHASMAVDGRIARVLLILAQEHGLPDARGLFVPQPLGRARLAQIVGCRVETLVRKLRGAEFSALVTDLREGFLLHDVGALREIVRRGDLP